MTDKILIPLLVVFSWVGTYFLSSGFSIEERKYAIYLNLIITFTGILYAFTPDKNKVTRLLSGFVIIAFLTGILYFLATKSLGPNAILNFVLFGGTLGIGYFFYVSVGKYRDEKTVLIFDFLKRVYLAKNPELFEEILRQLKLL